MASRCRDELSSSSGAVAPGVAHHFPASENAVRKLQTRALGLTAINRVVLHPSQPFFVGDAGDTVYLFGREYSKAADKANHRIPSLLYKLQLTAEGKLPIDVSTSSQATKLARVVGDFQHKDFKVRTAAALKFGGPAVALNLLYKAWTQFKATSPRDPQRRHVEDTVNACLIIIREMIYSKHSLANSVFHDHVGTLIAIMRNRPFLDASVAALEELLAARFDLMPISDIPGLVTAMSAMNMQELAVFCRVLALFVHEPEKHDLSKPLPAAALLEKVRQARRKISTLDRNQSFLINMPGFVDRLLEILTVAPPAQSSPLTSLTQAAAGGNPNVADLFASLFAMNPGLAQAAAGGAFGDMHTHGHMYDEDDYDDGDMSDVDDGDGFGDSDAGVVPPTMAEQLMQLFNMLGTGPMTPPAARASSSASASTSRASATSASNASMTSLQAATCFPSLPALSDGVTAPAAAASAPVSAASARLESDIFDDPDVPAPRASATLHVQHSTLPPRGGAAVPPPVSVPGDAQGIQAHMQQMAVANHQVEVLFVLCGLLNGRRRAEMQDRIYRAGGLSVIKDCLHRANWVHKPRGPPQRLHGPDCECHVESAHQIQLLRLLHALLDRDTDDPQDRWAARARFLHPHQIAEMRALDAFASFTPLDRIEAAHHRVVASGEGGGIGVGAKRGSRAPPQQEFSLIEILIRLLMTSAVKSPYRFWLSSCLETFLRGSPLGTRRWVVQQGLIQFLVNVVLTSCDKIEKRAHSPSPSPAVAPPAAPTAAAAAGAHEAGHGDECSDEDESARYGLQTTFDLLGECCKYNAEGFYVVCNSMSPDNLQRFMRVACGRIIDSNVFLRAFSFTVAMCKLPAAVPAPVKDFIATCGIQSFVTEYRMPLLFRLAGAVHVDDVNQENICCINTAVLHFVLADVAGTLEELVKELRSYAERPYAFPPLDFSPYALEDIPPPKPFKPPANSPIPTFSSPYVPPKRVTHDEVLPNFVKLLEFWRVYYTIRGRDQRGLVTSSGFRMPTWQEAIRKLVGDSPEYSLLYRQSS